MVATPTAPILEPSHLEWLVRKQPHPEAPGLADLIDDVGGFRAHTLYRRPWTNEPDRRRDPRRFADVDRLWSDLLERSPRRPNFRLVTEGLTTIPGTVTRKARIGNRDLTDLAAPNQIVDGYRGGATVVLQGLHLTDPVLARVANNLALELDQPIQVNAYLSPPSARGLDVHFDYHDVFVVQLEGSKRWRIWEPTERSRDPIGGPHAAPRPDWSELGDPQLDLVLEPGDVLYLPRGHPHVAETTEQESAHLTIGLLAVTWHRVVRRAIDDEIAAGRMRASIPASLLGPDGSGVAGAEVAVPDVTRLELDLGSVAVRRWLAREIWSRQASTRVRPRRAADPSAADGCLAIAPGPILTLSRDGDRSLLFVGDRTISMPDEAHPFLVALLRTDGPFERGRLEGLDDSSSRVVIGKLIDEGVLVPQAPGRGR
jgi:hypothetical protein